MSHLEEHPLNPRVGAVAEGRSINAEDRSFDSGDWYDKLDGDMRRVLDALADLHPQAIETLDPVTARANPTPADAAHALLRQSKLDRVEDLGVETQDLFIPGPAGPIPARLYKRASARSAKPLPVVAYWHGGGFVIADLDTYDASPRSIARFADCIVVSCHYRQAPENRFPAAHEDAFAAYRWIVQNAASFGGDPARVAVMGESAGGNLAANVAIQARNTGFTPPIYQVLVYPVAGSDMTTPSYVENADARPLNKPMMEWFVQHYLGDPALAKDPRIDLLAANLAGLPDATVICAELDPLRTEGERLAEKLEQSGATVRHHTFEGVTHEFFGMGLVVKDAAMAEQMAAHNLKRAFGTAVLPF